DILERYSCFFLSVKFVPAAAELKRVLPAGHPADQEEPEDEDRAHHQAEKEKRDDALAGGVLVVALIPRADLFLDAALQPVVELQALAASTKSDLVRAGRRGVRVLLALGVGPGEVGAGKLVLEGELAADLAATDLHLAEADAGGLEDLFE